MRATIICWRKQRTLPGETGLFLEAGEEAWWLHEPPTGSAICFSWQNPETDCERAESPETDISRPPSPYSKGSQTLSVYHVLSVSLDFFMVSLGHPIVPFSK